MAPAMAAAALPRVLMITDSVHRSTAQAAAAELKGRATLVVPQIAPGATGTAIGRLDDLLGKGKWDIIHFNFGFADLRYVDPATKSLRVMSKHAGGVRVSTPGQYEKNLRAIVRRLKATGAKLIWASTTPLEPSKHDSLFDPGSELTYNAIAARIMTEHKVGINDMHAWMLANTKKRNDPFSFKKIAIHQPIVNSILASLVK